MQFSAPAPHVLSALFMYYKRNLYVHRNGRFRSWLGERKDESPVFFLFSFFSAGSQVHPTASPSRETWRPPRRVR